MKVNVKKLDSNAVLPTYSKHGDAGMDLTATSKSMASQKRISVNIEDL